MKRSILLSLSIVISLLLSGAVSSAYAHPTGQKPRKEKTAAKVCTVTFSTNMHCAKCEKKLTENLSFMKGVKDLEVSLSKQEITVKYDAAKTDEAAFVKEINRLGYKAEKKTEAAPAGEGK